MTSNFFNTNTYFIDQKVNLFAFESKYLVYNDQGATIGAVNQKLTGGQKVLRLFVKKAMLPFLLEIQNENGHTEASISRGWTFFLSKITIHDANGMKVGTIRQKFRILSSKFIILDASEQQIAEISGDWKAWNFEIKNAAEQPIGAISKKWAGLAKEMFTTADKYNVTIDPMFTGKANKENKIAVLASAITIDMVLKESGK